jgi:Ser/Thr protein kinase RdoA (MazF antagonist)
MNRVDDIAIAEQVARKYYGQSPRIELIPSHYNAVFRLWLDEGPRVLKLAKRTPERSSTRKELFIFGKLAERGVPVPVIEHQDTSGREVGHPFFIMRSAGDHTVAEYIHEADDRGRRLLRTMGGVFALIHGVTFESPGQIVHDRVSPIRNAALERRAFAEWCGRLIDEIESRGLLEPREIKAARKVVGSLPQASGASLCHGDFHAAQCIVDSVSAAADTPRIEAVVDWEAASAGDPVYDYADHHTYMDNTYHPALIDCFREGYEAVRPLPRDYDKRYRGLRMIQQLVLVRTFHRRIEPDRVRRGIELYRCLANGS